jgi:hypothetical protein
VLDQLDGGARPPWITALTPRQLTTACAQLLDAVTTRAVRHRGDTALDRAAAAAARRTTGDGWAWSRRSSSADVSPLLAASLALYGDAHRTPAPARPAVYAD